MPKGNRGGQRTRKESATYTRSMGIRGAEMSVNSAGAKRDAKIAQLDREINALQAEIRAERQKGLASNERKVANLQKEMNSKMDEWRRVSKS